MFCYIFITVYPTNTPLINMGIWVGLIGWMDGRHDTCFEWQPAFYGIFSIKNRGAAQNRFYCITGFPETIFGSFGLSTKEPETIMNCLSSLVFCVVGVSVCAHLPLALG